MSIQLTRAQRRQMQKLADRVDHRHAVTGKLSDGLYLFAWTEGCRRHCERWHSQRYGA